MTLHIHIHAVKFIYLLNSKVCVGDNPVKKQNEKFYKTKNLTHAFKLKRFCS